MTGIETPTQRLVVQACAVAAMDGADRQPLNSKFKHKGNDRPGKHAWFMHVAVKTGRLCRQKSTYLKRQGRRPQIAAGVAFFVNRCVLATIDAMKAPGRRRWMRMASILRGKAKMPFLDALLPKSIATS